MDEFDQFDEFDGTDREIAEALRRRAHEVPATPLGYTDVEQRIIRRRRRGATMAAAAVMLPAVIGLGYMAGRNDAGTTIPGAGPFGSMGDADGFAATTTVVAGMAGMAGMVGYRCQQQVASDDEWAYFGYCEYLGESGGAPTTTVSEGGVPFPSTTVAPELPTSTLPPQTTVAVDDGTLATELLVVDASGDQNGVEASLAGRLGFIPRYLLPATVAVEQTMVVPLGSDVTTAFDLLGRLGVGGFDSWTPELIVAPVPVGVTTVLVVGRDWFIGSVPPTTTSMRP